MKENGLLLSLDNFHKDKSHKDGHKSRCIECREKKDKVYRKNNLNRKTEYDKYYNLIPAVKIKRKKQSKVSRKKWRKENLKNKLSDRLRSRIRSAIKNNQKVGSAVTDLRLFNRKVNRIS